MYKKLFINVMLWCAAANILIHRGEAPAATSPRTGGSPPPPESEPDDAEFFDNDNAPPRGNVTYKIGEQCVSLVIRVSALVRNN